MKHLQQSGFSLIELILVITIVALASVPILGGFTQAASSTLINEDIQIASQLRRDQGYAAISVGATNDALTGDFVDFSRTVTITEPPTFGACAVSATCKGVVVTVSRGLKKRAEINYVLVEY